MSARDLVAAASRWIGRRFSRQVQQPDSSWQAEAWSFYDSVPEVRFAATWIGNAMSKGRLYAGVRAEDGTVDPLPDGHPASELVARIAGGPAGQAQLLGAFGAHLAVAGEGWIVIRPALGADGTRSGEDWRILSVVEVSRVGDDLEAEIDGERIKIPPVDPEGPVNPDAPVAIRVWQPHPRRYIEADSPVRSSLPLLEELRLLNAAVSAVARSRLYGRGVLLVPHGVRFPSAGPAGDAGEDDLIEVFMQVAETAFKDPESAAAAVPIILEVPPESIGEIKRITFESDFDELALRLREEAIRRFAIGLEIPAEVVLGLGDVNHWGVWALQSEAIRLGIEPRLATVADALTSQWLRPLLEDQGLEAGEILVWYDTSPLRVHGNRAQTALEVYDRGVISADALRRETGFDDTDAPDWMEEPAAARDAEDVGEKPASPELPVDETTEPPATLPASVLGRLGPAGEVLARRIQARHGLSGAELRQFVDVLAQQAAGRRGVPPDMALLHALAVAAGPPDESGGGR